MHSCPELLEFSALVVGEEMEETSLPRHRVELRKLRKFHVTLLWDCSPLLDSLTLPELVDASLKNYIYGDWHGCCVQRELLQLFTRSNCKLDKLLLGNCGFDEDMALECFRHNSLSTLTEFSTEGLTNPLKFTDRAVLELTLTEDTGEGLLSNLSRLGLVHDDATSPGLIGRMILSRRHSLEEGPCQLRSFSLVTPSLDDDDKTCINMAVDFGLSIDLDEYDSTS
ncbi:hypothetical protein AX17_003904 [Amanita inopinata Kibby_2008]|nr:hypothetical protein AX17_003904 [Amanita inopinata Kibby_2008]